MCVCFLFVSFLFLFLINLPFNSILFHCNSPKGSISKTPSHSLSEVSCNKVLQPLEYLCGISVKNHLPQPAGLLLPTADLGFWYPKVCNSVGLPGSTLLF